MRKINSVEVENLTLTRGERTLFSGLSFTARAGEAVAITGPNGAGKTSLIRFMAGLSRAHLGGIVFRGSSGLIDPIEATRRECHLLGHQEGLDGSRTARDELLFTAAWQGGAASTALDVAYELGLAHALDLPFRKLSAGQRRRLGLIRLVAARRAVWLLDEPTTALDVPTRRWLGEAMRAHLSDGGLLIAAAHDPLPIPARSVAVGR